MLAQSFFTFHNGELIEKRNNEKVKLQSIVCYEQHTPKDSLVYDGNDVLCFHLQGDSIAEMPLYPYMKYYYCEFDESLQNNYIYHMIKYKQLQERILYFLATIDSEITDDGAFVEKRQTIVFNKDSYRIKYKKINMKFRFFAELETYRYEPLESMYINIHNGFLTKALFKGKKTDVNIIFEYQDGKLKKEKIFYSTTRRVSSYEEYSYKTNAS